MNQRWSGSRAWYQGSVITETRGTWDLGAFTTGWGSFNSSDQPGWMVYPGGEQVAYAYNSADFWGCNQDRWPIEQLPLAAKHMVGAQRQFVSPEESCYGLPELSLLAGSMLTYLAATLSPIITGSWDRQTKGTLGRLRRWLGRTTFLDLEPVLIDRI